MSKIKTDVAKTNSSYQKTVNRLKKSCTARIESIHKRKIQLNMLNCIINTYIAEGKITQEDLRKKFYTIKQLNKNKQ